MSPLTLNSSKTLSQTSKAQNHMDAISDPPIPNSETGSKLPAEKEVKLAKNLNLLDGVAIIVGSLIGSGIFITPTACLIYSRSVGASLVVWLLSGIFSLFGALSFAELGTTITKNGGEYIYILEAFGQLPAFLYTWVNILIVRPVVIAIVILSFGYYLVQPLVVPPSGGNIDDNYEDRIYYLTRLIGLLGLGILLLINCLSVRLAMRIQAFLTISKLVALAIIIVIGIYQLTRGKIQNFKEPFRNTNNIQNLSLAFYSGLFSYGGWNSLNSVTGEMKNPHRDLPLSIIIGLPLVTIIYVLANIAYLTVLSPEQMKTSTAVAFDFAASINFYLALAMPVFVALSAFGSANAMLFTSGRIFLMGARNGHLPTFFAMIHVDRLTPMPSILIQGLISLVYIATKNIFILINFMSFMSYFFTTVCVVGLLYLRWKYPKLKRPIKIWIVVHLLFLVTSCFILVTSLVTDYRDIGTGFIILIADKLTTILQCLLYLILPANEDDQDEETTGTKTSDKIRDSIATISHGIMETKL